ncbi:hypothetical protein [Phormidium nigroviride]
MKRTRFFNSLGSRKIATVLLAVVFVLLAALKVSAQTEDARLMVLNDNKVNINSIEFKRVEYVGECAGTVTYSEGQKARFVSSKITPGPNRRAIVTNVTMGMETNPYPYTDRSYDRGEYSEDFGLILSHKHKGKNLAVLEGENKLLYQIKEDDKVIEEGSLTAQVSVQNMGVFPRQAVCEEKLECRGKSQCYDSKGRYRTGTAERCFTTRTCRCR